MHLFMHVYMYMYNIPITYLHWIWKCQFFVTLPHFQCDWLTKNSNMFNKVDGMNYLNMEKYPKRYGDSPLRKWTQRTKTSTRQMWLQIYACSRNIDTLWQLGHKSDNVIYGRKSDPKPFVWQSVTLCQASLFQEFPRWSESPPRSVEE